MGRKGSLKAADRVKPNSDIITKPTPTSAFQSVQAQVEWDEFWSSDNALVVQTVDVPALQRLFLYRDEFYELQAIWMDWVTTNFSDVGAAATTPIIRRMNKLETMMLTLERAFGLNPSARARLGIEVGENEKTWEDIRKQSQGSALETVEVGLDLPVGTEGD